MSKNFKDLSEPEILALAISNEETDGRIYADFAARLKDNYPATAEVFKEMEAEEDTHRRRLIEVARMIVNTYRSPNKSLPELEDMVNRGAIDVLQTFSEAARQEFRRLGV